MQKKGIDVAKWNEEHRGEILAGCTPQKAAEYLLYAWGMSRTTFAELFGFHLSEVSKFLNGKEIPSMRLYLAMKQLASGKHDDTLLNMTIRPFQKRKKEVAALMELVNEFEKGEQENGGV